MSEGIRSGVNCTRRASRPSTCRGSRRAWSWRARQADEEAVPPARIVTRARSTTCSWPKMTRGSPRAPGPRHRDTPPPWRRCRRRGSWPLGALHHAYSSWHPERRPVERGGLGAGRARIRLRAGECGALCGTLARSARRRRVQASVTARPNDVGTVPSCGGCAMSFDHDRSRLSPVRRSDDRRASAPPSATSPDAVRRRWSAGTRPIADIDMRIAADGTWFHDGKPIRRPALVKLFASILRRRPTAASSSSPGGAGRHHGGGRGRSLPWRWPSRGTVPSGASRSAPTWTTSFPWDAEHTLRFAEDAAGGLRPYLHVRATSGRS